MIHPCENIEKKADQEMERQRMPNERALTGSLRKADWLFAFQNPAM